MNPYLPNAPYAADAAMLGLPISTPMTGNPQEGNVLLASVRNMPRRAALLPLELSAEFPPSAGSSIRPCTSA